MGDLDVLDRTALVLRLARHVTARHDLDDVLAETFRCLRPLVAFGGGSIQLLDDEGWIQLAAADPVAPAQVMEQRVPLGTSVAGRIVLTEQAVYLPDVEVETLPLQRRRTVSSGIRSYLGVPLVADGAAVGILQIDSPEPHAWSADERALFLAVAPVVAAAIQNARSHARASAARAQSQNAVRRLHEARQLVSSLRSAHRRGETMDVERLLLRLDQVVGDTGDAPRRPSGLPRPRAAAG